MNTHIVTKALPGPNGLIPVGTEIDASDFKKVDQLVAQRYLRPLKPAIDAEFEARVVAAVLKNVREGGELSTLFPSLAEPKAKQATSRKGRQ